MRRAGRWILGGVAAMTMAGGYPTDWNQTHPYNPRWPPHAKFHDAWILLLGTALGAGALYFLRKDDTRLAALLPAMFWTSHVGSFVFPNTGGVGTEFPQLVPKVSDIPLNEAVAGTGMLALTGIGYALARPNTRGQRLSGGCSLNYAGCRIRSSATLIASAICSASPG